MPVFQRLHAIVNIGGNRNSTTYVGRERPVTYPEILVLQAIHGGQEHVHSVVDVGTITSEDGAERQRLVGKYGKIVHSVFPGSAQPLPTRSEAFPTLEEVRAVSAATAEAKARVRGELAAKAGHPGGDRRTGPDEPPETTQAPRRLADPDEPPEPATGAPKPLFGAAKKAAEAKAAREAADADGA